MLLWYFTALRHNCIGLKYTQWTIPDSTKIFWQSLRNRRPQEIIIRSITFLDSNLMWVWRNPPKVVPVYFDQIFLYVSFDINLLYIYRFNIRQNVMKKYFKRLNQHNLPLSGFLIKSSFKARTNRIFACQVIDFQLFGFSTPSEQSFFSFEYFDNIRYILFYFPGLDCSILG